MKDKDKPLRELFPPRVKPIELDHRIEDWQNWLVPTGNQEQDKSDSLATFSVTDLQEFKPPQKMRGYYDGYGEASPFPLLVGIVLLVIVLGLITGGQP